MQKLHLLGKRLLDKLDFALCLYLGLSNEQPIPIYFSLTQKGGAIFSRSFFERTLSKLPLDSFISLYFAKVQKSDTEKLGIAMGKAMAKDLVISFDSVVYEDLPQSKI